MAISFVQVVDAGPKWTKVLASDGNTYTFTGDRNWRNNNPGNIEYGAFARAHGSIGTDGRFAVFPDKATGASAQAALQFSSPSYANKTISQAIAAYAPPTENDTTGYAAQLAAAIGASPDTKLSDLTPQQQTAYIAAQNRVEGGQAGTIRGPDGQVVSPDVARQFGGVALPPNDIAGLPPNADSAVSGLPPSNPFVPPSPMPGRPAMQPSLADAPLPAPDPLTAPNASRSDALGPTAVQGQTLGASAKHLVNLNGKMVAVGTYPSPSNPGSTFTVSDDGTGKAVVTNNDPGFMNVAKMGPNTVAGSVLGKTISDAVSSSIPAAKASLAKTGSDIGTGLTTLGSNVVSGAQNFLGGVQGLFSGAPKVANSNGSKAKGSESFTPTPATQYPGDLSQGGKPVSAYPGDLSTGGVSAPSFTLKQMTVLNPDYTAYLAKQKADPISDPSLGFLPKTNPFLGLGTTTIPAPAPVAPPPPQYITKTVRVQSGGGSNNNGSSPSSAAPKTITGSSTGRTYNVGQTYSNNNGTYVAQANGTFKRV